MNDTVRYNMIRAAIKKQKRKGVKIVDEIFGIYLKPVLGKAGQFVGVRASFSSPRYPKACAISCLLLSQKVIDTHNTSLWDAANGVLGQGDESDFVNGITFGFDNLTSYPDSTNREKAGYRIGKRLRREFIK